MTEPPNACGEPQAQGGNMDGDEVVAKVGGTEEKPVGSSALLDIAGSWWLIWSIEHRAWWAKDRQGYTRSRAWAGRYSSSEACQIVESANCDGDVPNEAMVLDA